MEAFELLQERIIRDEEAGRLEARVERDVLEGKARAQNETRCMRITDVRYTATAKDVLDFLSKYGEVVTVMLFPSTRGQPHMLNSGSGIVEFFSSKIVDKIETLYTNNTQLPCPFSVGMPGGIRLKRWALFRKDMGPLYNTPTFTAEALHLGNIIGSSTPHFTYELTNQNFSVAVHPGGLFWEMMQGGVRYQFDLLWRHMVGKSYIEHFPDGNATLQLAVRHPPRISRLAPQYETVLADSSLHAHWSIHAEMSRTVDFTPHGALGKFFAYRFFLSSKDGQSREQGIKSVLLKMGLVHKGVKQVTPEEASLHPRINLQLWERQPLIFQRQYYLECLLTTGLIAEAQLTPSFWRVLSNHRIPTEVIVRGLSLMMTSKRRITAPDEEMRGLVFQIMDSNRGKPDFRSPLPDYCMMVGRVLVTPTRIVRLIPEAELSNRILRHFGQHADRFIRITFGEEDGSILRLGPKSNQNVDLIARTRQILLDGITIAGRHFKFLAFSTSQLKEHSVWAFSPLPELTIADVHKWMGDFANIRCAAKYAARMGQCFSSSLDTVELEEGEVVDIPDITRNGYVFSDGCGLISSELAASVAAELKQLGKFRSQAVSYPCAYQLRFGGCKGVVVTYPSHPVHSISGRKMLIRPSMRKFEAQAKRLEVVGMSKYLPAFLNRQIISILFEKSLGVPDAAFQELQDSMLVTLKSMLTDSSVALHVLNNYASIECDHIVDAVRMMIEAGFEPQTEPYLFGLLSALRQRELKDLRNRTRIFVPESALLMGVVDELGVLEYGQVFIQIDKSLCLDSPELILGDVIVAKNPCFHPGDVRVLQAVQVQGLRHLLNVVVFPQNGPRPHCNEISGSDLDGDNYFCCWRKSLIPPRRKEEAMQFPAAMPVELERAVQISDVAMFFVNHALSDNLGIIANAHLAMADASPKGVFDLRCIKLADLHSKAVDFPKTGAVVDVPPNLRPQKYPDFMEKQDKPCYPSDTIIGRLYRQLQDALPPEASPSSPEGRQILDQDLLVNGYDNFVQDAKYQKQQYEQQLLTIMNQFNTHQECQLISGCVMDWEAHRRRPKKQHEARVHMAEAVMALRQKFQRIFEKDLAVPGGGTVLRGQQKASAWYWVTYHKKPSTSYQPLYSFAWIAQSYLTAIKTQRRKQKAFRAANPVADGPRSILT